MMIPYEEHESLWVGRSPYTNHPRPEMQAVHVAILLTDDDLQNLERGNYQLSKLPIPPDADNIRIRSNPEPIFGEAVAVTIRYDVPVKRSNSRDGVRRVVTYPNVMAVESLVELAPAYVVDHLLELWWTRLPKTMQVHREARTKSGDLSAHLRRPARDTQEADLTAIRNYLNATAIVEVEHVVYRRKMMTTQKREVFDTLAGEWSGTIEALAEAAELL